MREIILTPTTEIHQTVKLNGQPEDHNQKTATQQNTQPTEQQVCTEATTKQQHSVEKRSLEAPALVISATHRARREAPSRQLKRFKSGDAPACVPRK